MRFLCLKTDPVTSDSNYWLLGLGEGEAGAERGGYPLSTDLMIKWGEDERGGRGRGVSSALSHTGNICLDSGAEITRSS